LLHALDNVQAAGEVSSSQNIEATLDLFFGMLVRNAAERHMVETLLFREAFLASMVFKLVFCLVPDLFSFVSCVFLNQSLLVVHLHVNWVVHQTFPNQLLRSISNLLLNSQRQLFAVVFAVDLSLSISFFLKLLLLAPIEILDSQQVVIVFQPVLFSCFSLQYFVVSFNFEVVHLPVLVCYYVVLAGGRFAYKLLLVFLQSIIT